MGNRKYIEKLVFIALLIALSVVLNIFDTFISAGLSTQGARIGLANIVILTGIYYLDFKESLLMIVLKSFLTGLVLAKFMTFTVGFSGSLLSFFVMFLLLKTMKDRFSLVGVSIAGSIAHNIGQVIALTFYYGITIVFQLFWLLPVGIGTGIFIGIMVASLRVYLDKGQVFKTITNKCNDDQSTLLEIINNDEDCFD